MDRKSNIADKNDKLEKPLFTPLTPNNNIKLGVYEDALNYVFQNDNIRNIALSGAYGSGKSSILASYKEKKGKKILHISLAHFDSNDGKAEERTENAKEANPDREVKSQLELSKLSLLEWKILNQLIHQINPESVPQTNFQVKKKTSKLRLIVATLFMVALISLLTYITLFEKWINIYDELSIKYIKVLLSCTVLPEAQLIAMIICLVLVGIGLFWLFLLQRNRRIIKKLDVKGAEIEMFKDSDESYFDKYLNEVLYLFENVEEEVIVFEDMDRFNSIAIFERLREVNALVNHSRKPSLIQRFLLKSSKHSNKVSQLFMKLIRKNGYSFQPVRFFYLIRDDIFTNKDRLKFFDLIIPVVPVVDGSNAYDKFIEVFEYHGILEHFDSAFLQGFSFYVDEMRLLINICNEYKVYYQQLSEAGTDIDKDKLLAMIAYKNFFPQDFAELQLARGFIFRLLNSKEELIATEHMSLSKKIAAVKKKLSMLIVSTCRMSKKLITYIRMSLIMQSRTFDMGEVTHKM